jgi:hypothetical protein
MLLAGESRKRTRDKAKDTELSPSIIFSDWIWIVGGEWWRIDLEDFHHI